MNIDIKSLFWLNDNVDVYIVTRIKNTFEMDIAVSKILTEYNIEILEITNSINT